MPLDTQVVGIAYGQGLDTKTDPKVTAKPVLVQDGIFTNPHRISKRNGYDKLTQNIMNGYVYDSVYMCRSFRNELVIAANSISNGKRLLSYSPTLSCFTDRGKYVSVASSKAIIDAPEIGNPITGAPTAGAVNPSSATLNNITLYAYDGGYANDSSSVYITVVDNVTGAHIVDGQSVTSSLGFIKGYSKAMVLGSSALGLFYIGDTSNFSPPTSSAKLCLRIITVSGGGGVTVGSEIVIGGNRARATISTPTPSFDYCYDVVTTSGGAFIASANEPNLDLYTIDTSGATTHTVSIVSSGNITPVNVTLGTNGNNVWVYWITAGVTLKYAIYNASTLSSVLSATTAQTTLVSIQQIAARAVSVTSQTVFISSYTDPTSGSTMGVIYPKITQQTNTSLGSTGSIDSFINGYDIYSKPFTLNSVNYIALITVSPTVSTGFIVDMSDVTAVAKFLPTQAEGVYTPGSNTVDGTHEDPQIRCVRMPGFLNSFYAQSSSIVSLTAGFVVSYLTAVRSNTGALSASVVLETEGVTMGVASLTFDFSNINANQSLVAQDTMVLNGSIVEQYDGSYISELGFNSPPDVMALNVATTGGSIGSGTWTYYYVYRWIDSNGNLHQSAPSIGVTVKINSGTTNRVFYGLSPLTLTQKQNVSIAIYRTVSGGTIPYLLTVISNASTWTGDVDSIETDAIIKTNPQLYTEGGAVLDNIAPPSSMVMWTNNNRVWAVDSENPETNIEYSKTASAGTGISFSTGLLEVVVDSKYGAINGASAMDEKTVILKENGVGYFIGDGANDAGTGSSITNFQFIPSDAGCSNSNSVVLYPGGLLFRATNNKGIYQVSRGTQVSYFGMDVEAYNSQDIRSAVIISNKNQIRFLTSSGFSLLFDYVMNQWSIFTNHTGYSADTYNGKYTYARTDGFIYAENTTSFLDSLSSYALTVKLQFIKASAVQNFQRLKRVEMLGDYSNGSSASHGVQISAAYDFGTSFSTPVQYIFGSSSSSGAFQYRERLPRQKCDSVQLYIQEIVTGASGESCDFTDLGLEIAAKRGLNKLPSSKSV